MKNTPTYIKIIGWIGTACVLTAYTLNSFGIIPSVGFWYAGLNLTGAIFLGIRVYVDKNWSNLALEIFFGVVAIISILRILL